MNFINKNIVIIISLVLSYAIINFMAEDLPNMIYSILGMHVEKDFFSRYRFPVIILAFFIFPIIRGLKKKLNL